MTAQQQNRALSKSEYALARWMLEHGNPDAAQYLPQLEEAEVTPWRCPCGCASLNFQIRGIPEAPPGVHVLADFVMGTKSDCSGAFIYSSNGLLSGLEVYGLSGDAPRVLPTPEQLFPFDQDLPP